VGALFVVAHCCCYVALWFVVVTLLRTRLRCRVVTLPVYTRVVVTFPLPHVALRSRCCLLVTFTLPVYVTFVCCCYTHIRVTLLLLRLHPCCLLLLLLLLRFVAALRFGSWITVLIPVVVPVLVVVTLLDYVLRYGLFTCVVVSLRFCGLVIPLFLVVTFPALF